jgi:hypothetical protein
MMQVTILGEFTVLPQNLPFNLISCSVSGYSMKRTLRILALALAVVAIVGWVALGANRGWTRTSEPVKSVDQVTGIEGVEYRKKFVPGVELLGGALLGASVLAGASLFFRNQQTNKLEQNET